MKVNRSIEQLTLLASEYIGSCLLLSLRRYGRLSATCARLGTSYINDPVPCTILHEGGSSRCQKVSLCLRSILLLKAERCPECGN